jgi:hypothetical protein
MQREEKTAYHQAGHAVASHRFGFFPYGLTIVPDPNQNQAGVLSATRTATRQH